MHCFGALLRGSMANEIIMHGTTIVTVRKGGKVVIAGDGQVSLGQTVMKGNARKVRRIGKGGNVIAGFAGATADAFTLLERLEAKLEQYPDQLMRACVELAKDWRTDRYLRRLEAMMLVADKSVTLALTGNRRRAGAGGRHHGDRLGRQLRLVGGARAGRHGQVGRGNRAQGHADRRRDLRLHQCQRHRRNTRCRWILTFVPWSQGDLKLVARWLAEPHVRQWWGDPQAALAEIREAMESHSTEPMIVEHDGRPFAYVQAYDPHLEDGHPYQDQPTGTLGIDFLDRRALHAAAGPWRGTRRGAGAAAVRGRHAAAGHRSRSGKRHRGEEPIATPDSCRSARAPVNRVPCC